MAGKALDHLRAQSRHRQAGDWKFRPAATADPNRQTLATDPQVGGTASRWLTEVLAFRDWPADAEGRYRR